MLRQEHKFFINSFDVKKLYDSLSVLMYLDSNCISKKPYTLTSIYFDSFKDDDLQQKIDGIRYREKYRLRFYNTNFNTCKFEIKRKNENTIEKTSICLEGEEINQVLNGNYSSLKKHKKLEYVMHRMKFLNYKPKTIVKYDRIALYLPFNNIRVTLDLNLRSQDFYCTFLEKSIFNGKLVMPNGYEILEIKYFVNFPDYLINLISKFSLQRSSISKYVLSRFYNQTQLDGDDPLLPF